MGEFGPLKEKSDGHVDRICLQFVFRACSGKWMSDRMLQGTLRSIIFPFIANGAGT